MPHGRWNAQHLATLLSDGSVRIAQDLGGQAKHVEVKVEDWSKNLTVPNHSTDAVDTYLWHLAAHELEKPEREYRFHDTRKWLFDFAWPDRKLAVEYEGGIHHDGRHTRGKGYENDCDKYNHAALAGWIVLRFTYDMVFDGRAIQQTIDAFDLTFGK